MTKEQRAAIRTRCETATDGEWFQSVTYDCRVYTTSTKYDSFIGDFGCRERDAIFIANAHQDVPALLDALEAAYKEIERLKK